MKTTIKITSILAIFAIILTTGCREEDWYEDMNSFETVITSGVWELAEYYNKPSALTPNNKYSRYDYLEDDDPNDIYIYIYTYNEIATYSNSLFSEYDKVDFYEHKQSGKKLYRKIRNTFTVTWSFDGIEFSTWWAYHDGETGLSNDTTNYKIRNYSDNRIEIYQEWYVYEYDYDNFNHEVDTVLAKIDSTKITTYKTYINVEEGYIR